MGFQNGGEEKKRRGKVREGACWPVTPYLTSSCNKVRLGTKGAILMHVQNEAATFSSLPPPPFPVQGGPERKTCLHFRLLNYLDKRCLAAGLFTQEAQDKRAATKPTHWFSLSKRIGRSVSPSGYSLLPVLPVKSKR